MKDHFYSFVIPAYNEAESIPTLVKEIEDAIDNAKLKAEIIFINDGSTDNTLEVIKEVKKKHTRLSIIAIDFLTNFGKANALQAGFDKAKGDRIFTLDADLQDDPAEITNFINEMEEKGADMVSGWKYKRLDSIGKTLPSKIANGTMRRLSGVKIHDMNCGFKLYETSATKVLNLHGDMHRFIPALLGSKGLKISEVKVNHRKRKFGKSKYGFNRLFTSFFDFLTIVLQTRFFEKPLHFFGMIGVSLIGLSALSLIYLFVLWFISPEPIGDRPLFTFSLIMFSLGFQIIMTGLIGELVILRSSKREYIIREVL